MKNFVIKLVTDYCNLCDHVIAPSPSVEAILYERGVEKPVTVIPTGIERDRFADGDGAAARKRCGIPADAFVVGHVGRLATEKNLPFLARACAALLTRNDKAHMLIVGDGHAKPEIEAIFNNAGVADRLHMTGSLSGGDLVDAYHAMDVFAFASTSETQGMVLAEALMAGVPLVAIDAPGAREVVRDGENGRLLPHEDDAAFTEALASFAGMTPEQRRTLGDAARRSAEPFTLVSCTDKLVALYGRAIGRKPVARNGETNAWTRTLDLLEREWKLWSARAEAAIESIGDAIEP
jgi:glycosyltransferase involved in cell wall biosynthesis